MSIPKINIFVFGMGDTIGLKNNQIFSTFQKRLVQCFLCITWLIFVVSFASANEGITFQDIAAGDGAGISYRRVPSPTKAIFDSLKQQSLNPATPYTPVEVVVTPEKSNGAPGVAIFDHDNDGDLDIYVTNGPDNGPNGVQQDGSNSLYSNQLQETGQTTFVDVAVAAGVAASDQDSTGVCYGDTDNDGDQDLLVLGRAESNRLFENQGNGSFNEITTSSGVGGGTLGHTSCSMGDVNGDGLLDILVTNTFDWASREAIFVDATFFSDHNQLFVNTGSNIFTDVSDTSGIQNLAGLPQDSAGDSGISWAGAMVDYDLDGDIDIFTGDDQAANLRAKNGGSDVGFIHVFQNDGTGHFTDVTVDVGTNKPGQWMGLSFGDFNCDGQMDFFGTNMGDYAFTAIAVPFVYELGDSTSRWFLGQSDGTFADPGVGGLIADPFGWGTSAFDYDNDGDIDIVYYGHLLAAFNTITAENPGAILRNEGCTANFVRDATAFAVSTNHNRRGVQGVASGDLNNDGFVDIVTASSANYPAPEIPLTPYPVIYGSTFDAPTAVFVEQFTFVGLTPFGPGFRWNEFILSRGNLSVELSSGDNGNNWVKVRIIGTKGLTSGGSVNRNGIGAVVKFTPKKSNTVMQPILGGSSYASQNSLELIFGLGSKKKGTIEVLWPGGVRNRLDKAKKFETVVFPEIPCSFDGHWEDEDEFEDCVEDALDELVEAGILMEREASDFNNSMEKAFEEFQDDDDNDDDDDDDDDDGDNDND